MRIKDTVSIINLFRLVDNFLKTQLSCADQATTPYLIRTYGLRKMLKTQMPPLNVVMAALPTTSTLSGNIRIANPYFLSSMLK